MPTLTLPALAPKLARALYSRSWLRILDLWACRQARRSLYPVSWTAAFLNEVVRVPVFLMALGSAVASSLCLWHGRFLDGATLALFAGMFWGFLAVLRVITRLYGRFN